MNNATDVYNVLKAKLENTTVYYNALKQYALTAEDKNNCTRIKVELDTIENVLSLLTKPQYLGMIAEVYHIKITGKEAHHDSERNSKLNPPARPL